MSDVNDRVVLGVFAASIALLAFFLLNAYVAFGLGVCGLLALALALGFGSARRKRGIRAGIAFVFAAYVALLGGLFWLHRTSGELTLVLGLPASTAFLVYGIWPMPLAAGLLYAVVFRESILPEDRLRKFLSEYGKTRRDR